MMLARKQLVQLNQLNASKKNIGSKEAIPFPEPHENKPWWEGPALEGIIRDTNLLATHGEDKGNASLPVTAVFKLIQAKIESEHLHAPPSRTIVTAASYKGTTGDKHVKIDCTFTVQSLVDKISKTKLFGREVTVLSDEFPNEVSPMTCVMSDSSGIWLVSDTKGEIQVKLTIALPYESNRRCGFVIKSMPEVPSSSFEFFVPQKETTIKVNPSLSPDLTSNADGAKVQTTLPPTTTLSVQWTEQIHDQPKPAKEVLPLMVSANEHSMYSISEGLVSITTKIFYKIENGEVSNFSLLVDHRMRVLQVEGLGMKRWDVLQGESNPNESEGKTLEIQLEYGLEDEYDVRVVTEIDLEDVVNKPGPMSVDGGVLVQELRNPVLRCLDVDRHKGFIALEARSNVEVEMEEDGPMHEFGLGEDGKMKEAWKDSGGGRLTEIDSSELPPELCKLAESSILFAFKFLDSNYDLSLSVRKHADVDVVIALIKKMHVKYMMTDEGLLMSQIIAEVRNTQQQYLRLVLPPGSTVWSSVLSGTPVKPAMDGEEFLVPLQKADSKPGAKTSTDFTVELIYVHSPDVAPPMLDRGELTFVVPRVNIPINDLFVSVFLDEEYKYAEFEGDLRESMVRPYGAPESQGAGGPGGGPQPQAMMTNMVNPMMMTQQVVGGGGGGGAASSHGGRGGGVGVLPVVVDFPGAWYHKTFYFQQSLVVAKELRASVRYRYHKSTEPKQPREGRCVIL